MSVSPSPLLRRALGLDAVASGALALVQVAAAAPLAAAFAMPAALLFGSGLFLVGYTLLLIAMTRSARLPVWLVWLVVLGNVGWGLGCIALPFTGLVAPAPAGLAWLGLHAVGVFLFALLEAAGLRRSWPGAVPAAA